MRRLPDDRERRRNGGVDRVVRRALAKRRVAEVLQEQPVDAAVVERERRPDLLDGGFAQGEEPG